MAYALIIKDGNGFNIVEHVANFADETVYVPDWSDYGLKHSEYRKSHHLISEVMNEHPDWTITQKEFDIPRSFNNLV